jgi:lysophospholipase L1-like esterase
MKNDAFLIKPDDRVIFWGDSITDNSFYCRTIEQYVHARYPHWNVDFFNLGCGGDRAITGPRMERDLVPLKPTLVMIMLGMNDGQYQESKQEIFEEYMHGMENLVSIVQSQTAARIVLITPTQFETGITANLWNGFPIDNVYPGALRRLSDGVVELGKREQIPVIDLNRMYEQTLARYRKEMPKVKFSADGVHPDATGNLFIALHILKGLGADGNMLDCAIDGKSGSVLKAVNQRCHATIENGSLAIERSLDAYPFKVNGPDTFSVDSAPWHDDLNRNTLTVTGLTAPYYLAKIEGAPHAIAAFTPEELARGVNLTTRCSALPESTTARFAERLVNEKHAARYECWRGKRLAGVTSSYDFVPYRSETAEARYLVEKADMIHRYICRGNFLDTYTMRLVPAETPDLFPGVPFAVLEPYPSHLEVQVLFTIDTNPWKNLLAPDGKVLHFTGPLKLKIAIKNDWALIDMYDDGTHGDENAGDGIYSAVVNLPGGPSRSQFAFDDAGKVRGQNESLAMELVKTGIGSLAELGLNKHPSLVPDTIKKVEITAKHFAEAVALGFIKVKT